KSRFGLAVLAALAATRTTVPPSCTSAEPPASLAILPVLIVSVWSPSSIDAFCSIEIFPSSAFPVRPSPDQVLRRPTNARSERRDRVFRPPDLNRGVLPRTPRAPAAPWRGRPQRLFAPQGRGRGTAMPEPCRAAALEPGARVRLQRRRPRSFTTFR